MGNFMAAVTGYPTAIFTVLLGVVLVYWVLALLGMVDFESSGLDVDVHTHADTDPGDISALASYLVALSLGGVPFSIAVSFVVLFAWVLSCLAGMWLLPLVPTAPMQIAGGTIAAVASLALALPLASLAIRPLRGLFVSHVAESNAGLVGQHCRVTTGVVNDKDGRAEVARRGASLNIRVWAATPNRLARGARARIVAYDAQRARYRIEADDTAA